MSEKYSKYRKKNIFSLKLDALMIRRVYDYNNAILEIHMSAGGTEAQDWTEMLQRLYARWINNKGFKFSVLDYNSDTEGDIKVRYVKSIDIRRKCFRFLKG